MAAVTDTFTATGQSATFQPQPSAGYPFKTFNVTLWGTFVATIVLKRSFDQGVVWHPITAAGTAIYVWTTPCSESVDEGEIPVLYRLECTSYTSGTGANYRLGS